MTTLLEKQIESAPLSARQVGALADTITDETSALLAELDTARKRPLARYDLPEPRFLWPLPLNRLGLQQKQYTRLDEDSLFAIRHIVESHGKTSLELFRAFHGGKRSRAESSRVIVESVLAHDPDCLRRRVRQSLSRIGFLPTVRSVQIVFVRTEKLPPRVVNGKLVDCWKLEPRYRVVWEERDDSAYSFKVEDESGKRTKTRSESRSLKELRWRAYLQSREYSFRRLIRRRCAEHVARKLLTNEQWQAIPIRQRQAKLRDLIAGLAQQSAKIVGLKYDLESAKRDEFRRAPKERASQWPQWSREDVTSLRARMRETDSASDAESKIVASLVTRGESVESARDFVLSLRNGRSVRDAASYHLRIVPIRTAQALMVRFRDE